MRKFLLFALLIVLVQNSYAQIRVLKDERGEIVTEVMYSNRVTVKYRGSAYLKDSVELGTFSIAGGQELQKPVLFDVLDQNFLAYIGDKFVPIQNTDLQLGNLQLQYIKGGYHHGRYITGAYYETYYNTKVKILVKYGCAIKRYDRNLKEKIPEQIFNNYAGELIHQKYYFLQFPDTKMREIDLNNKSVRLALTKQYDGIDNHIRQWNRDIKTEKDIADLLDYLDKDGML
ncbi:hypothetical protein [Emticicia fontis]